MSADKPSADSHGSEPDNFMVDVCLCAVDMIRGSSEGQRDEYAKAIYNNLLLAEKFGRSDGFRAGARRAHTIIVDALDYKDSVSRGDLEFALQRIREMQP